MKTRPAFGTTKSKVCGYCGATYRKRYNMKNSKYCDSKCAKAAERAKGPARFWAKVDKTSSAEGCWLYTGFKKWDGYGWIARTQGENKIRYMTAHRYAWILLRGPVPDGLQVLHRCDNPPCCNPDHLFLGTIADNHADKVAKLRHSYGERSKRNKLTTEDAATIRAEYRLWRDGSHRHSNAKELAARYGVCVGAITAVTAGRSWNIAQKPAVLHPGRVRPVKQA